MMKMFMFMLLPLATVIMEVDMPSFPIDSLTPGKSLVIPLDSICKIKNSDPPWKVARQIYKRYKINPDKLKPNQLYIDYFIPLDLGGKDTITNMWPMAKHDFLKKRALDKELHRQVCNGLIYLQTAQYIMKTNWLNGYQNYVITNKGKENGNVQGKR